MFSPDTNLPNVMVWAWLGLPLRFSLFEYQEQHTALNFSESDCSLGGHDIPLVIAIVLTVKRQRLTSGQAIPL
jgi:hypothetical protein